MKPSSKQPTKSRKLRLFFIFHVVLTFSATKIRFPLRMFFLKQSASVYHRSVNKGVGNNLQPFSRVSPCKICNNINISTVNVLAVIRSLSSNLQYICISLVVIEGR